VGAKKRSGKGAATRDSHDGVLRISIPRCVEMRLDASVATRYRRARCAMWPAEPLRAIDVRVLILNGMVKNRNTTNLSTFSE
jgi:hypothetical protein